MDLPVRLQRRLTRLYRGGVSARDLLARIVAFPEVDLNALTGGKPALVVAPHPDDESLGCGGLIAQASARGERVDVVVVTDGSASHPGSTTHPPAALAALRMRETIDAIGILGLSEDRVSFLNLPDGRVPTNSAAVREIAGRIAAIAQTTGARTIFASWRYDTHPDHVATYRYAELAARMVEAKLFAYPVWGLMLSPGVMLPRTRLTGFSLPVGHHLQTKRDAVLAHRSQTSRLIPDSEDAFQLDRDQLDNLISGTERYILELP